MPGIVSLPSDIEDLIGDYSSIFRNEPQRVHFGKYILGLITSPNKTVTGMANEFASTTDPSCDNRFLTEAKWDEKELNRKRLELLQQHPQTRYSAKGVIALDNVLIDHDGELIADVGYFWDHAEQRHKIAHDDLYANYVCPSGKHYPLDVRRFRKREICEAAKVPFLDHNQLFRELVTDMCAQKIPGDFAFDSYFTNAENLNHIHAQLDADGQPRAYVGDLKTNRKIWVKGREIKASEFASTISPEMRTEARRGERTQWFYSTVVRIPNVNHKVRILLIWKGREDADVCKILVSNRVRWDVHRMTGVYQKRWTGTETFHRDGKQHLGMGDCQLRDTKGQTRHMYLVMVAYSTLMQDLVVQPKTGVLLVTNKPRTIGEACRMLAKKVLRETIEWAVKRFTEFADPLPNLFKKLRLV